MAQTYSYSKISRVMYPMGKFTGDQRDRFLDAPFSVVQVNGRTFVQPVGTRVTTESIAQSVNSDGEVARMIRQDYYSEMPTVVPLHRFGDGQNDWIGMFRLGFV